VAQGGEADVVQTLRDCHALKVLFPEIDALYGVPAPAKWHPEIGFTPAGPWPWWRGQNSLGVKPLPRSWHRVAKRTSMAGDSIAAMVSQRLRVPNDIRDLARLVAEFHDLIHTLPILQPKTIVKLFDSIL
jgi:tRNA nucleotidyltransferase (CCA-adding enzyme)